MTPRSDFMKELFADFLHSFPMLTKAEVDIIVESTNIQSFMKVGYCLGRDRSLPNAIWCCVGLSGSTT